MCGYLGAFLMFLCFVLSTARVFAGTSVVMVLPAAIMVLSAIFIGAIRFAFAPMFAWLPILVLCLFLPS